MEQRSDDNEDTAIKRYKTYENNIEPVIEFYKQSNLLKVVNGEGTISEISDEISGLMRVSRVDFKRLDNINTQEKQTH